MTTKKYTDQEIKNLFPEQAKNEEDIYDIASAIVRCGLEITKQAAKDEKAKTGEGIYWIALAIYDYGPEIVEKASKDERAKTGVDIYWMARAIHK